MFDVLMSENKKKNYWMTNWYVTSKAFWQCASAADRQNG